MIYSHFIKYLKAHTAGLGAALTLLIEKLNYGNALTLSDWIAVASAYVGVGAVVSVVPHGGEGVAEEESVHDDGTDDEA